ncbi:MAG: TIM-barrel domain-containing protein [Armatimonadota bacterium]
MVTKITPINWKAKNITIAFVTKENEGFFGGGDVWNGSLNQRGKQIEMWVRDGTPDECAYVPFFVSTNNYGIFFNTYERGFFDFNPKDDNDNIQNFYSVKYSAIDDKSLEFYIMPGEPKEVIMSYASLTGLPPLPPKWSFLPWKWRDEHKNWEEVFEDAEMMRKHDIPCSAILIDNPWQKYGLCSFEFDPERFPDAQAHIDKLKEMDYMVLVWVAPFTTENVPNFQTAIEKGYAMKNKDGEPYIHFRRAYIDFTNPEAYDWWKEEMKKVIRMNINGFKMDRGQLIPEDSYFYDGSTGASMHNKHAVLFNKVCYDALREVYGDNITTMPRSGAAGSQSYKLVKWPGDIEPSYSIHKGLGAVIIAAQSAGISVFPFWGSDIGGFERGGPNLELLARWSAFGCFSPLMQLGGKDPHEPWHEKFGNKGVPIYRLFATLHTELLPYTYTYAISSHEKGLPIIRPLVLEYPNFTMGYNENFTYTYGHYLLVAPIYNETGKRDVLLPPGKWIDFWNWNNIFDGDQVLTDVSHPLDSIPLYIKSGAIIPMEIRNNYTGIADNYAEGKITVLAIPDGKIHFVMRDKDNTTDFWVTENDDLIKISWKNSPKSLIFIVRCNNNVKVLDSFGRELKNITNMVEYNGENNTYCFDKKGKRLYVSPDKDINSITILTQ